MLRWFALRILVPVAGFFLLPSCPQPPESRETMSPESADPCAAEKAHRDATTERLAELLENEPVNGLEGIHAELMAFREAQVADEAWRACTGR